MHNTAWNFKNISENEGELLLYGTIFQESYWDDEITPKQFTDDLKELGDIKALTIRINSGGGSVFAANAIYSQIKSHSAEVVAIIDGLAASAATIIAMAADEVRIPKNAMMMVHDPLYSLWGSYNASDFEKMIKTLNTVKETIVIAYENKTGKSRDELAKLMTEETWMTGEVAVQEGFADLVIFDEVENVLNDNMLIVNSISHDISKYKNFDRSRFNNLMSKSKAINNQVNPDKINNKFKGGKEVEIKNVEDLKKQYPELVNKMSDDAKNEATEEERNRLKAIDEIANTLDSKLVADAKYGDQVMNAEKLAFEAIKNDQAKGKKYFGDAQDDVSQSGAGDVTSNGVRFNTGEEESEENIAAMVDAANEGRK